MILAPLGVRRSLLGAARRVRTDAGAQACTFKGGLGELTDRLAARHASRVRLGVHVDRLDGSLGRFTIRGQGPDGPVRELVDRVVLTVPAPVAGRVLAGIAPAAANALGGLTYNEVRVVHLDVPSTPEGFGFQVALGEPLRTRGVTWSASVFGREGMAVAYLGGGLDREIASWSDDRVSSRAVDDFEEVHGARAHVLGVGRSALPAYDASWEALAGLALPAGVTLAANYRARLGIAGRIAEAEAVARELARSGGQPASSVR
jgi:oxygen-dependent protoporphyrinogen oxidase